MRHRPTRSARPGKTYYLVAAIVPALIVVLSVTGFVWARKPVSLVVDGRKTAITTQATRVSDLLEDAGVPVGDGDVVTPSADARVLAGMTVLVKHAVPVTIDFGGERVRLDVVGETVADALVAAGVHSILNFAPVVLSVPSSVDVRRVDLASELQILAFHQQRRGDDLGQVAP